MSEHQDAPSEPLDELQRSVARFVRSRRTLRALPEALDFANAAVAQQARLSPVEQLEIYRQQFWLRHTAALLEDFPGVAGIVGQRDWERLCEEYLEREVLEGFDLAELGRAFPEHVASRSWLEARELSADMARLEWAYVVAFGAEDMAPLSPAKIAQVPDEAWETVKLVLSPSLTLLKVTYPVVALRRRLLEADHDPVALPEPEPSLLAVYRRDLSTRVEALEAPAFALLEALSAGAALLEALERVAALTRTPLEALGNKLEGWFSAWAKNGMIVDLACP